MARGIETEGKRGEERGEERAGQREPKGVKKYFPLFRFESLKPHDASIRRLRNPDASFTDQRVAMIVRGRSRSSGVVPCRPGSFQVVPDRPGSLMVVRDYPWLSGVLDCCQRPSMVVPRRPVWLSETVRGRTSSSEVVPDRLGSCQVIPGRPRSSKIVGSYPISPEVACSCLRSSQVVPDYQRLSQDLTEVIRSRPGSSVVACGCPTPSSSELVQSHLKSFWVVRGRPEGVSGRPEGVSGGARSSRGRQ